MPLGDLHERVAAAALRAAAGHGFALGGSNALIAHGLIQRPTLDVDLYTDHEHGVEAAADAVEAALAARPGTAARVAADPAQTGMAKELLHELAPLLAEEGIDVDNIDVPDMQTLQRALNRAMERHNMSLFTPVGQARELAAVTLRLAAEAITTATPGSPYSRVRRSWAAPSCD
jgi:hypothetical protein